MLEILIVLCLAGALYLLLRHYPDAKSFKFPISREAFSQFFGRFGMKDKTIHEEIAMEIDRGQNDIVSPLEIQNVVESYNENPEIAELLCQADKCYIDSDLRGAEDKAVEAIGKNKRCAKAYVVIGNVAYARGQFDEAKEAYKTAIKCDAEIAEAFFGLGEVEYRLENFTEATDLLMKSVVLEKGHADWYAELGKAYLEIRQYAKAAKALRHAASLDIDNKEYRDLALKAEEKQKSHSFYTRPRSR